jgi:molybdopterin/thiamine biosynthesis adenylyltransferase/rhodanese-related sulfurtransferase
MSTYRDLLQQVKREIRETTAEEVNRELSSGRPLVLIDVREPDEVARGILPGAIHIPRGFLEIKVEGQVPDRASSVVVYCAAGARSAFAAKTLQDMGYENVRSLAGGFTAWRERGFRVEVPRVFTPDQLARYSRHIMLPEVGEKGQAKLLDTKVLLLGAGGLGSPAAYYLAAAGVGTLGIVDNDVVDESNLQRQILHNTRRVGMPKVQSARETLEALNPDVRVVTFEERLTSENALRILEGWDVVVDGCDNFPTRYLVNDACVMLRKPNVHGSIYRFEGQVTVFAPGEGPCYRCLYPEPPPPEMAPSCADAGVLGVLPGVIGVLQAIETIKLVLGAGKSLVGRLVMYDALEASFRELKLRRDPACPACGENPRIHELTDIPGLCGGNVREAQHAAQ